MKRQRRVIHPGDQFGQLTVIEPSEGDSWLCKCTCGKEKVISARSLIYMNTHCCGCLRGKRENPAVAPGMRFGMLTVLKRGDRINKNLSWVCQCDCGQVVNVFQSNLLDDRTHSCGCNQYVQPVLTEELKREKRKEARRLLGLPEED